MEEKQALETLREMAARDMEEAARERDFAAIGSAQNAMTAISVLATHFGVELGQGRA